MHPGLPELRTMVTRGGPQQGQDCVKAEPDLHEGAVRERHGLMALVASLLLVASCS